MAIVFIKVSILYRFMDLQTTETTAGLYLLSVSPSFSWKWTRASEYFLTFHRCYIVVLCLGLLHFA